MTSKGGKPSGGDAAVGVEEGEGGVKKGESSWMVTMGVRKVHLVALMRPRVANKRTFKSMRGEFREGRRVILDKSNVSKNSRRKGEEGRGG